LIEIVRSILKLNPLERKKACEVRKKLEETFKDDLLNYINGQTKLEEVLGLTPIQQGFIKRFKTSVKSSFSIFNDSFFGDSFLQKSNDRISLIDFSSLKKQKASLEGIDKSFQERWAKYFKTEMDGLDVKSLAKHSIKNATLKDFMVGLKSILADGDFKFNHLSLDFSEYF